MPLQIISIASAVTVYVLNHHYSGSWWWAVPIFLTYLIAYNAYRMLIYERFLNPISRLPGPKGHWFLGEFASIQREEPGQPHLRWLREYRNPTGLVSYPGLFYTRRLMPASSSTVQHILNNWTIYIKPAQARTQLKSILGDGLLTAEGEVHKRQRKVLNPAFATGYVRDIVPIFWAKSTDMVDLMLEAIKSQSAEGTEVFKFLSRSTLDIIGAAGFGYEFNSLHNPDDPFAKAYATIFHQTPSTRILNVAINYLPFLRMLPFPRVVRVAAARKAIVEQSVKLVRDKEAQTTTGKDILSLMIAENRKAEGKLAEMELVGQVMTFILAGHETTSTAVSWGLHILAQHPEIQTRLRSEVSHMTNPTFEQIESCRYLNNVCREILRFIPPVSVTTRVANVTDKINGITIPKGTIIFIPIMGVNFDEAVWGPDVDNFNPDRWDKLPETVTNYSYLTFLQGPRSCIGRRFAETEMKVLLVALIQQLQFDEVVKGRRVEKQAIITTRPKGGMYLKLSPAI